MTAGKLQANINAICGVATPELMKISEILLSKASMCINDECTEVLHIPYKFQS